MAMYAVVVKGGKFTFTIGTEVARGLRPSDRNPRNEEYMVTCDGAVGREGVLSTLDNIALEQLNTSFITDAFPFPQVFAFSHLLIVCGLKKIYERKLLGGIYVWSLVYTATTEGGPWSAVDFQDYIYISNGEEAVIRSATTGEWALDATKPVGMLANFNSQVFVGAPCTGTPGVSLTIAPAVPTLTAEIIGGWT